MQPHYDFRNGFSGDVRVDVWPLPRPQGKRPFAGCRIAVGCRRSAKINKAKMLFPLATTGCIRVYSTTSKNSLFYDRFLETISMRFKVAALAGALKIAALPVAAEFLLSDGTKVSPLEMFQECDVCPEMIVLPLGEFLMGGPPGESKNNIHWDVGNIRPVTPDDPYIAFHEGPVHSVVVDLPVAMGRNEVTYDEWMACVEDGGCGGYVPQDYVLQANAPRAKIVGNHPVITVSFNDALTYTDWLNRKVGAEVYRLPTEAEWEYAARAGTQTPFAQGEEITTDQANFLGSATEIMLGEDRPDLVSRGKPVPVNELDAANAWGLRHMSGNVAERTMSCRTERYQGWETSSLYLQKARRQKCERLVTRGGAYPAAMDASRVAGRGSALPKTRTSVAGFRVLRELNKQN